MQSKIYRSLVSRSKDEIHLLQHAHKCLNLHSQRNNYLKIYPIQLIVQHSTGLEKPIPLKSVILLHDTDLGRYQPLGMRLW
ncbi:hypothetical protein FHEFKHOI_00793 [Candidatus Methanoperedenaceae archaeon GB50]|nr:hypothetical protein FHEFKHOI_00793 [Candidatus Methanoperedenaceae archaeon GB50]CAD7772223.1 MAG: hypothetical protein KBONHNOK_00511 [Candidatus Methanoperedenaceae archaeon GB50]